MSSKEVNNRVKYSVVKLRFEAGDRWSVDVRLGLRAGDLRLRSGRPQPFGLRATLVGWIGEGSRV